MSQRRPLANQILHLESRSAVHDDDRIWAATHHPIGQLCPIRHPCPERKGRRVGATGAEASDQQTEE
jgi:hypothetical protein